MAMHNKGLTKLMEECGELIQIAAKQAAYLDTDDHPDGKGSMRERMIEEMGDVQAAITFVIEKFKLSPWDISARAESKLALFNEWDANETPPGVVDVQLHKYTFRVTFKQGMFYVVGIASSEQRARGDYILTLSPHSLNDLVGMKLVRVEPYSPEVVPGLPTEV
jgi:NTP pyrophosphatase (non-canonical NTP hydrolase)